MKIAWLNAFPNLSHSAEREFIERCLAVLAEQGVEARAVVTSDDIQAFDPDCVIVTHEFVAKTTDHFTVGLLWSPTRFYRDEPERLKAIRSWDLVVPINAATRRFARNLHFPLRHDSAVSGLDFLPSAPDTPLPLPDASRLGLAYVGAHWDGQRHRRLLEELARATDLHVYGPASAWSFLPAQYRGPIPFDGRSLVQTLHRHGVVLALHKLEHVEEQTPSMRVFEGCAARCAVITEPMAPLVERFGDALHYLDTSLSPRQQAQRIAAIVEGYRADPAAYAQQVSRAHAVFSDALSLERLLRALVDEVAARRARAVAAPPPAWQPQVSIIIRCGSRPLPLVQRAVASLARQTHPHIGLLLVRFAPVEGFDAWVEGLRQGGRFAFVDVIEAPGGGVRSAAMWAGLRHVRTELFGLLDDDDELFADHLASLVALLARDADCDVAYSGVVKQEEDGLHLNTHARFKGDLGVDVPERRELKFMDDFSLDRLLRFDNFIQSNTWLARARVLVPELLDDPQLEVGEDMYFYLLLASRFRFRFSGRVTALWNWRSNAADNSMLAVSQARWARCGAEVIQRLSALEYPGGWLGREVLGRGRGVPAGPAVAEGPAVPGVAVGAAVPSKPRAWLKRALSLASGRRAFVAATEPIPFDAADVVCSIDFTQARWPELLVNARGLSDVEPWGSWTDGPQLTLEFRSALPPRLIVHLVGHAHASQHQRPLVLALGASEATLRMSARLRACRYTVTLDNPGRERSLVLRIPDARAPAATDPASRETRRLGVGLVRLDIVSA